MTTQPAFDPTSTGGLRRTLKSRHMSMIALGGGGFSNLAAYSGFMSNGIVPVLIGAVVATGFYFGTELIIVAAASSEDPEMAVAKAIQSVISRIMLFYIESILLVVTIVPWDDAAMRWTA
jgi:L-asparagine transporter-like permease